MKTEAHVAPVMRASLPLMGIGAYVPAKDSDIGWARSVIRSDRRDDLVLCDGDQIMKASEARRPV